MKRKEINHNNNENEKYEGKTKWSSVKSYEKQQRPKEKTKLNEDEK